MHVRRCREATEKLAVSRGPAGSARRAGVSTRPLRCGRSSPRRSTGGARSYTAAPMRWNTRPPRDGGRRLRYASRYAPPPVGTVAARRSRARAASRVAKRVRTGRAVEGGARGSNGGDGACARRGGAGAFPATLARGLPLAPGLKPRSYLRPSAFNLEPFAAFAGSILHFVFRSFGPGVRYKGVGVYSRLMPAPRAHARLRARWCVFALTTFALVWSLHAVFSACTPTARRESTHSTRASSRERRDKRRDERRPRPRRAQRVGPSAPQLMLGGGPSWVTSASFHRVAMMDARPCGAGPTGRLAGSTSSLRRARLFSCPLAPRPL